MAAATANRRQLRGCLRFAGLCCWISPGKTQSRSPTSLPPSPIVSMPLLSSLLSPLLLLLESRCTLQSAKREREQQVRVNQLPFKLRYSSCSHLPQTHLFANLPSLPDDGGNLSTLASESVFKPTKALGRPEFGCPDGRQTRRERSAQVVAVAGWPSSSLLLLNALFGGNPSKCC